jgi:hypothetical protein
MVEWKFIEKGLGCPFDYYEAAYKKYHNISIAKIDEGEYTVMWKHLGTAEIIKTIYAKDWDVAKASAIRIVKDYLAQQAVYWRDMKIGFANWIEDD